MALWGVQWSSPPPESETQTAKNPRNNRRTQAASMRGGRAKDLRFVVHILSSSRLYHFGDTFNRVPSCLLAGRGYEISRKVFRKQILAAGTERQQEAKKNALRRGRKRDRKRDTQGTSKQIKETQCSVYIRYTIYIYIHIYIHIIYTQIG